MAEYGRIFVSRNEGLARAVAEEDYRKVAAVVDGLSAMDFLSLGPVYGALGYRMWGWRAERVSEPKE